MLTFDKILAENVSPTEPNHRSINIKVKKRVIRLSNLVKLYTMKREDSWLKNKNRTMFSPLLFFQ